MLCMRSMRQAILDGVFPGFVRAYLRERYGGAAQSPQWVQDALTAAGVELEGAGADDKVPWPANSLWSGN